MQFFKKYVEKAAYNFLKRFLKQRRRD